MKMARKRSTIKVAALVERVNRMLETAKTDERRQALCVLIESVLHETGGYAGFNYVDWMKGGSDAWRAAGMPEGEAKKRFFGPEYKRCYHYASH